jgi:MFS-type transporter involved in bile tolerance (Atg22 family)
MSVYSLMFLGMTPFGSFLAGLVAERFGAPTSLGAGAVITLIVTVGIFTYRQRTRARQAAAATEAAQG